MAATKDKLVSLELMKYYHDYNKATYAKTVTLVYNGSAIINNDGATMSFTSIKTLVNDSTNRVVVQYNARTMRLVGKSDSAIEFWEVHEASNKMYIDKLTVSSDNRVALKESQVALSGDIIKNLSGMTGDATHRTVTDTQITSWNNKLDSIPTATVAETKQYLSIS